jgi:hypothetical protein
MHCVLLGCVKMLLTLWFNKRYKHEIHTVLRLNCQMWIDVSCASNLSNFIARLPIPKSLTDFTHFKAAELNKEPLVSKLTIPPRLPTISYWQQYIHEI